MSTTANPIRLDVKYYDLIAPRLGKMMKWDRINRLKAIAEVERPEMPGDYF